MNNKETPLNRPIIALSGGFNPARKTHIAMILEASKIGDVVIILNSDKWCIERSWNGQLFSVYENRKSVLEKIPGVTRVVPASDDDGTVCKTLEEIQPDYFGNGGIRTIINTPEVDFCKKNGIGLVWYLGDSSDETTLEMADLYLQIAIAQVYGNDS